MILPFLGGTFTVVFLFLMQFVMNKLDELLGKGIDPSVIIELIILNIAWMVVLAVPMGVLFATLMAFGGMSATYETTVIKASGGSLIRMMTPVLIAGFALSSFMYWYNDVVLPESNHRASVLLRDIQRTKPSLLLEKGRFIQQLDGYTILTRDLDSVTRKMYGVTIYDNRSSIEKNIVSADSGQIAFSDDYSKLVLDLYDGEVHQSRNGQVDGYRIIDFENYQVISRQSGFSFEKSDGELVSRGQRELSISDMQLRADKADSSATRTDSVLKSELNRHLAEYIMPHKFVDTENSEPEVDSLYTDSLSAEEQQNSEVLSDMAMDRSIMPSSAFRDRVASELENSQNQTDGSEDKNLYSKRAEEIDNELSVLRSRVKSRLNQKEDYEQTKREYMVEIYKKYSIPFACFVFVMVGCPLGIKTKGGNFGTSAVISLAFYVLFWVCLIGGEKLADEGILEPWLAMWLCDIVVGVMGLFLILKVNNENFTLFRRK